VTPTIDTTAVVVRESREVTAADFSPVFTLDEALGRKKLMNQFIGKVLEEGSDYGAIPGAGTKKVLLKAGAEKLSSIFGLAPRFVPVQTIEDWTGAEHGGEPLFYYEYRCELSRGGRFAGEGIGSCNSWESKYRHRWVPESAMPADVDLSRFQSRSSSVVEFDFAIDKAETRGQYGKPAEYWNRWKAAIADGTARRVKKQSRAGKELDAWEMGGTAYRVPNDQFGDVINTCQKMAQKRALVAAVLVVTNCSDAFTQDVEDFADDAPPPPPARNAQQSRESMPGARTAQDPQPPPLPPLDPNRPWNTFSGMCAAFAAIKENLKPYTGPYYEKLKKHGVEHANDFSPARLGNLLQMPVSAAQAAQKASDCYRELLAVVADYEAMKSQPTPLDEHLAAEESSDAK
jgi:hypothetical protein